jgi:hypothetical protein
MVYSEEFLDGIYDEGYKARVWFPMRRCPYEDRAMANAWWDGYDRATEDEGVFTRDLEVVF